MSIRGVGNFLKTLITHSEPNNGNNENKTDGRIKKFSKKIHSKAEEIKTTFTSLKGKITGFPSNTAEKIKVVFKSRFETTTMEEKYKNMTIQEKKDTFKTIKNNYEVYIGNEGDYSEQFIDALKENLDMLEKSTTKETAEETNLRDSIKELRENINKQEFKIIGKNLFKDIDQKNQKIILLRSIKKKKTKLDNLYSSIDENDNSFKINIEEKINILQSAIEKIENAITIEKKGELDNKKVFFIGPTSKKEDEELTIDLKLAMIPNFNISTESSSGKIGNFIEGENEIDQNAYLVEVGEGKYISRYENGKFYIKKEGNSFIEEIFKNSRKELYNPNGEEPLQLDENEIQGSAKGGYEPIPIM